MHCDEKDACINLMPKCTLNQSRQFAELKVFFKVKSRTFFPDPCRWSRVDVIRWMEWTMQQFHIPATQATATPVQEWATEGTGFVQLTEAQFKDKLPQVNRPFRLKKNERT